MVTVAGEDSVQAHRVEPPVPPVPLVHCAWKLVAGGSAVGEVKDTIEVPFGDGETATLLLPHRTSDPCRFPRPVLDAIAWLPRLTADHETVPAPQLADRLPDLHVIGLDAVGSERFTCLEAHAGSSDRDGSRADPT